jgi:hypothetical protein
MGDKSAIVEFFGTLLDKATREFCRTASVRYSISENELNELWDEVLEKQTIPEIKKSVVKTKKIQKIVTVKEVANNNGSGCSHVFSRGVKCGQMCGSKILDGGKCRRHHKPAKKARAKTALSMETDSPKKLIFRALAGHLSEGLKVNDRTKLVLRNAKEGVIGKLTDTGDIQPLESKDEELCRTLRPKVAPTVE